MQLWKKLNDANKRIVIQERSWPLRWVRFWEPDYTPTNLCGYWWTLVFMLTLFAIMSPVALVWKRLILTVARKSGSGMPSWNRWILFLPSVAIVGLVFLLGFAFLMAFPVLRVHWVLVVRFTLGFAVGALVSLLLFQGGLWATRKMSLWFEPGNWNRSKAERRSQQKTEGLSAVGLTIGFFKAQKQKVCPLIEIEREPVK